MEPIQEVMEENTEKAVEAPIIVLDETAPIPKENSAKQCLVEPIDEESFCEDMGNTRRWRTEALQNRILAGQFSKSNIYNAADMLYETAVNCDKIAIRTFSSILRAHEKSGCVFAIPLPHRESNEDEPSKQEAQKTSIISLSISPYMEKTDNVRSDIQDVLHLFGGMAEQARQAKDWRACIKGCEDYKRFAPPNDEGIFEIMKLQVEASCLLAEELRQPIVGYRVEASEKMKKGDYDGAMKAHQAAVDHEKEAAEVMIRLVTLHKCTDCVFSKFDMELGEVSLKPASQE